MEQSYGIHLLVEKPIAMNTTEAKLLQEYTTSQNIKVLVGHHRRFNPYIVATKRNLSKCGKIIAIQGTWTLSKPDQYFIDSPWRTTAESGGVVAINLVHDIDLLQYLFGPIFRIYAEPLSKQRLDHDADEGCVLTINFHSGIMGTFICSDNVASPINFEAGTGENPTIPKHENLCGVYRIFGTKGTLSMPDMTLYHQKNSPSWTKSVNEEVVKVDCGVMPFDLQLNHFVDVIEGKEDPKCCIEDGISALLCIKAVMKSMEIGMPVEVEST
ncbi:uncharacterized protein J8A68_001473 [[Candida] subhashii]|uniref:Gfo/Idh/MocA-like oxidoreductase C-terminal domain-containing protein n=1 Tax=[Candida] subhashii TaxID=561895 RepID=A0A8J5QNC3_9ASCO|nr:uncharacterized protein J8A68_001473 [[Candida] subhashii]KAG7665008.1 hypothetical protein J8A68_001473 [[Candida] subhashii]